MQACKTWYSAGSIYGYPRRLALGLHACISSWILSTRVNEYVHSVRITLYTESNWNIQILSPAEKYWSYLHRFEAMNLWPKVIGSKVCSIYCMLELSDLYWGITVAFWRIRRNHYDHHSQQNQTARAWFIYGCFTIFLEHICTQLSAVVFGRKLYKVQFLGDHQVSLKMLTGH